MPTCIFCKIIKGEIPSVAIWEDAQHLAILDVNPNTRGMTLVLTKAHYDSYAFAMPDDAYARFMAAAKTVAGVLERGLGVARVAMVAEGMGVNHAHLKLYPLHGVDAEFKEMWAEGRVWFDRYEGYVSTKMGPAVELEKLRKVGEEVKRKQG